MALSFVKYTLDSGLVASPVLAYGTIDMLSATNVTHADQLVVELNGDALTITTDYTVDSGAEEVTIVGTTAAGLVVGDVIVVKRVTKRDARYVNFVNNAALDESDLDLSANQNFYLIQELIDGQGSSINLDVTLDRWNGLGKSTYNFGDAVANDGLVTLRQMLSALEGAETAVIDNVEFWSFSGDGTETDFVLTDAGIGYSDPKNLLVHVGGVIQTPTTSYTVSGGTTASPTLEFAVAPGNGANIQVRTIYGLVKAVLQTDIVDGSALAPGSVSLGALDVSSGDANRFIVADAAGALTLNTFTTSYISNLASTVKGYRLDEFAVPTGSLDLNGQKIIGLATPTSSTDGATKAYVDAQVSAAIAPSTNVGAITVTGTTSANLGAGSVTGTNSGSTAMVVYAEVSTDAGSSGSVTLEVKTSTGAYTECAKALPASTTGIQTLVGFVPAGGSYRVAGTAGTDLLRLCTQQFT